MGRRRDDDEDDDFGLRTPTRKLSKKKRESGKQRSAERKRETARTKRRESGKQRSAERKRETGRTKRKTGKQPSVEEAPARDRAISEKLPRVEAPPRPKAGAKGPPIALLAGIVFVGGIGGMIALVMAGGDEPQKLPEVSKKPRSVKIVDAQDKGESTPAVKLPSDETPILQEPVVRSKKPDGAEEIGAPAETIDPDADALDQLAKKSATHAAVARILRLFNDLHDPSQMLNAGPLAQHFRERQKREEELIEELRAMGPTAVDALKDVLLGIDRRQYRIFLGKALAGIEGPGALEAVKDILGEVKDVALQTTMVRYLPEGRDSTDAVGELINAEENANLRTMLMREYHRRLGDDMETGRDLFRTAALEDPDANVRAEAVTIIGRRGDPRDMSLMEDIISRETNLSIRQRAIVSYAETGKGNSLSFLEQLVRNPDTNLPVAASSVLAIGRIGGAQAVQSLDLIAQTHPNQEIRTRANRLAQSLRRRAAEKNDPQRVKRRPMRVDPVPLRRNN